MIDPLKETQPTTTAVKERNKLRHLCHLNFSSSWDADNKTYGDCTNNPPEVMEWKVMAHLFTT